MKTMNAKQAIKKNLAVAALAAACVFGVGSANAQWVVTDPGHTIQNIVTQIKGFAERYGQHIKEYTKLQQQVQHFQQQVVKLQSMLSTIGMPAQEQWKELNKSEEVAAKCASSGGGGGGLPIIGALTGAFKLDLGGDVAKQQRQICANIVSAKVDKYNYTVRFARDTLPEMERQMKELEKKRNSDLKQGTMEAVANDSARLANGMSAKFANYEGQMQAYDSYIAAMEDNQRQLVETAMNGRAGILGSVFKTTALKMALDN
ncbi:DUF4141 domain-containing protein [Lysobacter sp. BMK333-48F3]|uniref:DUF4141 domain-containing protein n=1 Tax=Lysobacter sp. BMK333-48F3 TaxID=2867962 RepID=UPI001C8C60C9|nr:DUF4141 domain-containing protein [Lysobacter sp. BMK333-48F3]MBX9403420.1 DUF4141 domain-containing protein [Lysobacter sp. BMK333-48F3]